MILSFTYASDTSGDEVMEDDMWIDTDAIKGISLFVKDRIPCASILLYGGERFHVIDRKRDTVSRWLKARGQYELEDRG